MNKEFLDLDLSFLPEEDKVRISSSIADYEFRQSLRTYNALVERCFGDCVNTFYRKSLGKQEENCVRRCAEKFLQHSVRAATKFAELNQGASTQ
ncbi:mitochondrial import inner membrane translocase subunit Tim9-like [Andrographis paniculata]|uniref:mitochondrial import inner membrane translocase subunit Tim9-like n=1 Tax=Andrographis paniculata TaxID=175694 RepID=UPI0021E8EBD6|nr:mitochondrial import inner membrane translocase subunit Tim9-like [Andrographis paniculata]